MPHRGRGLYAALAFALDLTLIALLGALALLAVAGPGIYEIGGVRLKLRTAANHDTRTAGDEWRRALRRGR